MDDDDRLEEELFEGTILILTLPDANFTIGDHICEVDEQDNSLEGKLLDISLAPIDPDDPAPLISNGFSPSHDVKWWIGGDFYENTWTVVKSEQFSIYLTRTIDQAEHGSVSIAQSGPIFAEVVPEFPGLSLLPVMYQLDVDFANVTCTNVPSEAPTQSPSQPPTQSPTKNPTQSPTCENKPLGKACGGE